MVNSKKYKLVKGKTGKSKKVVVMGVKKVLYKKVGSQKLYVISKGRMTNLVKYKKMKMKGGEGQTGGKRKKRKGKKTKGGGGDNFFKKLLKFGIKLQVHYIPIYKHTFYKKKFNLKEKNFPHTEKFYNEVISLPIFFDLSKIEIFFPF